MKKFLINNLISFIKTAIVILVLAYPFKNCWNNGICKALTCASQINHEQSMYLIGIIVIYIVAFEMIKD